MWKWTKDNASSIAALGTVIMALVAILALVGFKYQVDASESLQQHQAAREIYREFLSLTIEKPQLARANYCEISDQDQRVAYEHYVEYILYTAEQVMEMNSYWHDPMFQTLSRHAAYLCARKDWASYPASITGLLEEIRDLECQKPTAC